MMIAAADAVDASYDKYKKVHATAPTYRPPLDPSLGLPHTCVGSTFCGSAVACGLLYDAERRVCKLGRERMTKSQRLEDLFTC